MMKNYEQKTHRQRAQVAVYRNPMCPTIKTLTTSVKMTL
jgi:hypothetical protein